MIVIKKYFSRSSCCPQEINIHFIIPLSAKLDKTSPPQSACLFTLCSLFLLTLLSGLYSLFMFCQHHLLLWRRRAQKQTVFTFLQVANATQARGGGTIPLHSYPLRHQHPASSAIQTSSPRTLHSCGEKIYHLQGILAAYSD